MPVQNCSLLRKQGIDVTMATAWTRKPLAQSGRGQGIPKTGAEQLQSELMRQQQILTAVTHQKLDIDSENTQHDRDIQMLREHLETSHHQQEAGQAKLL